MKTSSGARCSSIDVVEADILCSFPSFCTSCTTLVVVHEQHQRAESTAATVVAGIDKFCDIVMLSTRYLVQSTCDAYLIPGSIPGTGLRAESPYSGLLSGVVVLCASQARGMKRYSRACAFKLVRVRV